jgi:PhnB protein
MQMAPYLPLDGATRDALDVYARTLGGDVVSIITFGEAPGCGDLPDECHDRIMHAAMVVDGQMPMASDSMPGQFEGNKGMAISLHVDGPADAETLFKAMSESGQVTMGGRRRSGPNASACWSTASACRGSSTTQATAVPARNHEA